MTNIAMALEMLEKDQTLKISPIGCSMCPFFLGGRDDLYIKRPIYPLKPGEIALFQRPDGQYVIHRIHHVEQRQGIRQYYMLGDNQTWLEGPIPENELQAVAVKIMRKGRLIDCRTNRFYRFTAFLWLKIRPIRPIFIKIWNTVKSNKHQ